MNSIAIVGVGLIGGSFGLAIREAGFQGEIIGVSSASAIEEGLRAGAIDRSATLEEATAKADCLYLAQPVDRIMETIAILGPLVRQGCLVTDAGSTKAAIVKRASECLPTGTFLGGHPLAGRERRGARASDPQLFRGRPYVLTSDHDGLHAAAFREWISRIGANIVRMSPEEHDATVAFTSHLPQLISTTLANTLAEQTSIRKMDVFGTGLIDMTRLALSPPDLWSSILSTNTSEVAVAIDRFIETLLRLKAAVGSTEVLEREFQSANAYAKNLRKGK